MGEFRFVEASKKYFPPAMPPAPLKIRLVPLDMRLPKNGGGGRLMNTSSSEFPFVCTEKLPPARSLANALVSTVNLSALKFVRPPDAVAMIQLCDDWLPKSAAPGLPSFRLPSIERSLMTNGLVFADWIVNPPLMEIKSQFVPGWPMASSMSKTKRPPAPKNAAPLLVIEPVLPAPGEIPPLTRKLPLSVPLPLKVSAAATVNLPSLRPLASSVVPAARKIFALLVMEPLPVSKSVPALMVVSPL